MKRSVSTAFPEEQGAEEEVYAEQNLGQYIQIFGWHRRRITIAPVVLEYLRWWMANNGLNLPSDAERAYLAVITGLPVEVVGVQCRLIRSGRERPFRYLQPLLGQRSNVLRSLLAVSHILPFKMDIYKPTKKLDCQELGKNINNIFS